ncbi:ABC transporter permease [Pedobacter chinensis]|uniref:ABC transporter permease n=1 Tax=Pedobacter chinensis TaxID=2282421 RepID=A0A369Q095_9SPHI|nr:ABC transporter permease [Pedobacter chinensis]RDC56359.1 ABC transporter permease [Pedobacter chinensis]
MKDLLFLFKREFLLFFGNKIMVVLYIGGPILYGILFGIVFSKGKLTELPIVVIDKDSSPTSNRLIDMLNDNELLKVSAVKSENVAMKKTFMSGKTYAVISIPEDFEARIMLKTRPEISVYINNSNLLASGYAQRGILAVTGTLNAVLTATSGRQPEAFHLNTFRLYNPASNYLMFVWPSYLAIILQSVIMVVIALSFAAEFENGTFKELTFKSKSVLMLITGKVIPYWTMAIGLLCILGIYFYFFKLQLPEHLGQALLVTALFIATISFQGIIAGTLFKSQLKSIQFLMVLSLPSYISSGFSWPYESYGWAAQTFGALFPIMPFVNGFRILFIEHGNINHITNYVTMQLIQLIVYFLIATVLIRYKKAH